MATNNISKGELFRRYQLQKSLEYEEEDQNEEQLEFNDQLESGKDGDGEQAFACEEEEAAKTSTCSNEASTKKRKKMQKQAVSKKVKKFAWTDDKVEDLLKYINDYKTNCDFKGIDFEADLASLYAAVRKCMARHYPLDFGPEEVTLPEKELKNMNKEEYNKYISESEAEKALIKSGCSRIKEKTKALRQDYRNAVNKGSRSGSGRIVKEHYDFLTDIWGGSPATTALSFGIGAFRSRATAISYWLAI